MGKILRRGKNIRRKSNALNVTTAWEEEGGGVEAFRKNVGPSSSVIGNIAFSKDTFSGGDAAQDERTGEPGSRNDIQEEPEVHHLIVTPTYQE
jgi:hypothetical protein